jgi:hypothetical protein
MNDMIGAGMVEVVQFKAKAGISDAQIRAVADALQRDVEGLPGYISRRLLKSEDGQWLDIVDWTGLDEALQAAEAIMARPSAQSFMELVEPASITMLHLAPVQVYRATQVMS